MKGNPLRTVLTAREFEVCELVAEGKTGPQIAEELGISTRTVEAHIYNASRLIPGSAHPMKRILLAFARWGDDEGT